LIKKGFIAEIDRLRGLFAILVVLGHSTDISMSYATSDFVGRFLTFVRGALGFQWVVGFVVLSGFCIHLSCMKQSRFSLLRYFEQRTTRIFPLLIACVLLAGGAEWVMYGSSYRPNVWAGQSITVKAFLINLLGAGGFWGQFGCIAPAYTISYELLYYFLWGVSLSVIGNRTSIAIASNCAFVLIYILAFEIVRNSPFGPVTAVFKEFIVLIYFPWLIGAATAAYLDQLSRVAAIRRVAPYGWIILLLVIACGGKLTTPHLPAQIVSRVSFLYYAAMGLAFALLILDAYQNKAGDSESRMNRFLGEMSYPLYLVHGPVIVFLAYLINVFDVKIFFFWHFFILVGGALLAASLFVVAVERPVMRFRKFYFYNKRNLVLHAQSG
jgi:peptidoglycan/LPS O-acetylase OafA/YrhL